VTCSVPVPTTRSPEPTNARIPSGQVLEAGAGAGVDVAGTRLRASVRVDAGTVALFLEISSIVGGELGDPRSAERPHAREVPGAGEREGPGPGSGSGAPRSGRSRDAGSSISGADREDDGAAITPVRPPLGRPLDVVSGSTGRAQTYPAHDGPDVPGLLERFSIHRDGPARPMTSAIAVSTFDLVPSTGPPG
jgi:hypothetical protein